MKMASGGRLRDLLEQTLEDAQTKIAAADARGAPVAEREPAPAPDFDSEEGCEKLASALDFVAEKLAADEVFLGNESKQGGKVLPVGKAVPGTQSQKKDHAKHDPVDGQHALETTSDSASPTALHTDAARAPGGPAYPAGGVLKTSAALSVHGRIQTALTKQSLSEAAGAGLLAAVPLTLARTAGSAGAALVGHHFGKKQKERGEEHGFGIPQAMAAALLPGGTEYQLGRALGHLHSKRDVKEKRSESAQGGTTLTSKSGEGKVPDGPTDGGNDARKWIASNEAAVRMTKRDAKAPQKRMLSEVLKEPAMSKATDSVVHENLRNATAGGVKIAAVKALLRKVAAGGCTCDSKGECEYCKLKAKAAKRKAEKSNGDEKPRAEA